MGKPDREELRLTMILTNSSIAPINMKFSRVRIMSLRAVLTNIGNFFHRGKQQPIDIRMMKKNSSNIYIESQVKI